MIHILCLSKRRRCLQNLFAWSMPCKTVLCVLWALSWIKKGHENPTGGPQNRENWGGPTNGRADACRLAASLSMTSRSQQSNRHATRFRLILVPGPCSFASVDAPSNYAAVLMSSGPSPQASRPRRSHPDPSLPQPHHHPRRRHHRSLAALPAHRHRHCHQPPPRSPLPVSRLPSTPTSIP